MAPNELKNNGLLYRRWLPENTPAAAGNTSCLFTKKFQ